MDIEFTKSKGEITGCVVNHRAVIADQWEQVIRYDTHHGRLHIHRFWRKTEQQIEYLEKKEGEIEDYSEAYERAQTDVKKNWQKHRRFLEAAIGR